MKEERREAGHDSQDHGRDGGEEEDGHGNDSERGPPCDLRDEAEGKRSEYE